MSDIAVKCFPLEGVQNYTVEDFQDYLAMRTAGVYAAGDNLLVEANDPEDMAVAVLAGVAWLLVGEWQGVSFPVRTDKQLTIEDSDAVNDRVDSIVCGIDLETNIGYLGVRKGAWAGSAPAPVRDATAYEIILAHISVPANTTAITAELITDTRTDAAICGFINEGAQIINDLTTVNAAGITGAQLGRISEGPTASMPETPAVACFYFDTDTEQMMFYSKILTRWIPQ